MKNILAEWSQGGERPGLYCPGAPSDRPHSPCLTGRGVHMWSVGAAGPVQQPEQTRAYAGKRANADCAQFVIPLYSYLFCHL